MKRGVPIHPFALRAAAAALLCLSVLGCPGSGPSSDRARQLRAAVEQEGDFMAEEFHIYTTLAGDVVRVLDPYLRKEFPNLDIKWTADGDLAVREKLRAEVEAHDIKADLLLLSDPFLLHALREDLKLLSHRSIHAKDIPEAVRDPEGYYVAAAVSFVVIVYDPKAVGRERAPKAIIDLASPDWTGKAAIPDPTRSSAGFALAATASRRYGWDYFRQLRANGVQLAPDDGSVIGAILAGKASVGATTLEKALAAKKAGQTIDFLYPTDGVIMIPEMLAIPSNVHKPDVAKAVYDFILSKTGQDVIVSGYAHSPQPEIAEPVGAKPWHDLVGVAMTWTHPFVADVSNHRAQIDEKFRSIMAN